MTAQPGAEELPRPSYLEPRPVYLAFDHGVFAELVRMVNGKDIFNVHRPNSLGLIEGFCAVCEQPWVDLLSICMGIK